MKRIYSVDTEGGSRWDVTRRTTDGPRRTILAPVSHSDHFRFAWAGFVPPASSWTAAGIISPDGRE